MVEGRYGNMGICYLYGSVCNGFEAGKIHYEGHWKGWALEVETFLDKASAIWAQKSQDFQGPSLPMPRVMEYSNKGDTERQE
jgi:hypothetical protein